MRTTGSWIVIETAFLLCLGLISGPVFGQCSFSNFFNSMITLSGDQTETVACVQGSQYVAMSVVSGETYRLDTCNSISGGDSQLTLYDATDTATSVDYNDDSCGLFSDVVYTATFTGTLYAQVNEFNCVASTTCYTLDARCTTCGSSGAGCAYRLDLFDSSGNGWNGASIEALINGVVFNSYTFTSGFTASFSFALKPGDVVGLSFLSGNFDNEISYDLFEVTGGSETLLFKASPPLTTGPVFTTQCPEADPLIHVDRFEATD